MAPEIRESRKIRRGQSCILTRLTVPLIFLVGAASAAATDYSWEEKIVQDGITVSTRKVEGSKHRAVRAMTHIEAPLSAAAALVRDTKRCPELAALCRESFVVRRVSETEVYVYTYNDMPWPVKDRDVVVRAQWSQNPSDHSVTMKASAVEGEVAETERAIRLKQAEVSWDFIPLADGEIRVVTEAHIDPEGPIPAWFTNLLVVNSPLETLTNMRHLLESGQYDDAHYEFISEPDD